MTTSNVDSEISQYIKDHGICTTFGIFVTDNEDNLIEWSSSLAITNASQLFNYWFGKFKSTYQQCFDNPKRLKAPKLNPLIWNEVLNGSMSKKRLRTSFEDGVSNLLVATGNSIIAREMDRLAPACTSTSASDGPEPPSASVGSESPASGPPSSSTSTSPLELEYCDKRYHLFELMPEFDVLTPFVVKKSRYTLKDVDKEVLRKLSRKNDSVSERMLNEIIRVLLQDGWSDVERHTVKLLLSRVVNLMDPDMLQNTQDILTPYQFHVASKLADDIKNSTLVLDLVSSTTLDTLIDTSASLHDFRLNVKKESLKILDSWDINTDCNQMLTVLDIIGAYLNNKKLDEEASELTMYRRFAFILDFLFDDPEMKLTDGEIVSDATRMAMEQNNYEHAATFGRRIDLLMKVQGTDDPLELASNEWKSKKTGHLQRKQQSKNIRTNCAILNKLYVTSNGKIKKMMAMDFVGYHGYLYLLQITKDSYVASIVSPLLLPIDFSDLYLFKDTIKYLFVWKNFLRDTILDLKLAMKKSRVDNMNPMTSLSPPIVLTTPHIFFTPKNIPQ